MQITAQMVQELRKATDAGVLDCKNALVKADGNFDKAVEILREKGLATAAKKASREANEGMVGHYIHAGGRIAALVEVNCETDFVQRTEDFQELVHDLAMQIVAADPTFLDPESVPADILEEEKKIYRAQMADSGKPDHIVEKIIEGKLAKFFEQVCLMEQPFIKDGGVKVKDLVTAKIAALGENIIVRRFCRFEVGK